GQGFARLGHGPHRQDAATRVSASPRRLGRRIRIGLRVMLYWLVDLSDRLSVLNVCRSISFRPGGAVITALFFVFMFGPMIIDKLRLLQCKGQPIRADGPKSH